MLTRPAVSSRDGNRTEPEPNTLNSNLIPNRTERTQKVWQPNRNRNRTIKLNEVNRTWTLYIVGSFPTVNTIDFWENWKNVHILIIDVWHCLCDWFGILLHALDWLSSVHQASCNVTKPNPKSQTPNYLNVNRTQTVNWSNRTEPALRMSRTQTEPET